MKTKRIISIILALVVILCLAACGNTSNAGQTAPAAQENTASAEPAAEPAEPAETVENEAGGNTIGAGFKLPGDLPHKKVAAIGIYSGMELYTQWKKNMETLLEPFNIEIQFIETSTGTELESVVESVCVAGVDGIIAQNYSETGIQIAQEYGVPWVTYCTTVTPETLKILAGYDNFLGVVTEDDVAGAEHCAQSMYDAGCRKVALVGLSRGLSDMMDYRADSFIETFKSLGGEIIAEDYSLMAFNDAIATIAASHPEMDGMFFTMMNDGVFQALTTEGLVGKVKVGCFDFSDSAEDFFDNGMLVFAAGGQSATMNCAFPVLYSYMYDGTYLIPDRTQTVFRDFIEIHNSDEFVNYNEYVRYSPCYTPDELGSMVPGLNPDFTFEEYEQINANFSIQDVMNRTAG